MTDKTISIKENVYYTLVRMKIDDENFSDCFLSLVEQGKSIVKVKDIAGTIDVNDTDARIQ